MDPLTIGIGAIGLGMKLFGGFGASEAQSHVYEQQQKIAGEEQKINEQKQQAFELQTRRSQMENFRNVQRARAMGASAAANQGASMGSGLAGGQAQATDQGNVNNLGLNQNAQIGRNIFSDTSNINMDKITMAQYQSQANTDMGWANLGGSLMSGAGTISNIAGAASAGITSFGNYVGNQMIPDGALSGGYTGAGYKNLQ